MKYKLICFDMDGVIFQHTNFWMQLHKALGSLEQGQSLTKRYIKTDYSKLVEEVVEKLWKGKLADKYFELIENAQYNPGVKETITELKKKFKICIITSGPLHLLERAMQELGIEKGISNELVIKENKIIGEFKWPVGYDNKLPLLEEICKKYGIDLKEVIAIGNDDNDIPKFKHVGFSIAFNTDNKELREIADKVVEGNDLRLILPIIGKL